VIGVADEILVLDSFSSDATPAICNKFPELRFFQHTWQGYAAQRNLANSMAQHEWILSLDADEVLTSTLLQSIAAWKENPVPAGFNRLTNYEGNWIRHGGWYPDFKFRLFKRSETFWDGIIHEKLILHPGAVMNVKKLEGDCLHYSFPTAKDHVLQTDKFSRLWAKQALENGRTYSFFKRWFGPALRFVRDYLFLGGFRDGAAGLKIALVSARAIALRQSYLKALLNESRPD